VKRISYVSSLALVAVAVAGCNSSFDVKTESNSGLTINSTTSNGSDSVNKSSWTSADGKMNSISNETKVSDGKTMRVSARNINGLETKLEAKGDVVFLKGKASKVPADAKVTLFEKRDGIKKEGELRSDGTQIKVWIKKGGKLEPGTAEDQAWADNLVASFNWDDTPDPEKKKELAAIKVDDPQFSKKLATLHYAKDITEVLMEKVSLPSLSTSEQTALIDATLEKAHYDKDQKAILLKLIERKDLAKAASTHLLDNLEKIHYEADRKLIQRKLFDRASAK
jgi:hypothetical protein